MRVLSNLDPEGANQRVRCRLKRRAYRSKVKLIKLMLWSRIGVGSMQTDNARYK